jgi:hypothetical protein
MYSDGLSLHIGNLVQVIYISKADYTCGASVTGHTVKEPFMEAYSTHLGCGVHITVCLAHGAQVLE